MESPAAPDEEPETPGSRLRAYLLEKTGGKHGWVNKLERDTGIKRQSISAWMNNRGRPERVSIDTLAAALGVRPYEIVAVLDGDGPVARVDDERLWEALEPRIERLLDERLGPRRVA